MEEKAFEVTTLISGNVVQYHCDSAKFDATTRGWLLSGVGERECRWVIVPAASSVVVCVKKDEANLIQKPSGLVV